MSQGAKSMTKSARRQDNRPEANPGSSNTLQIEGEPSADMATSLAQAALRPSVRAGVTAGAFSKHFGEVDLTALVSELAVQEKAVNDGNLRRPEAMLIAQAQTLEAIFHELARRAALNMGEYLGAAETYMRLALKAQSQCRATLETLGTIKNPAAVAFVRQANIAHGPQQVNNGAHPPPEDAWRERESEIQRNKLLGQERNERVDSGTLRATVDAHSQVETVGEVHGPPNGGGQG